MFQDKFTKKASNVLFFARYESSQIGAQAIEPEHLLLGLLRSDPELIQMVLPSGPNEVAEIRALVEANMLSRPKIEVRTEMAPFSKAAERVMGLSAKMSEELGQSYIASEHILLGLIGEGESLASRVLSERGLSVDTIKTQVGDGSITDQGSQGSGQGVLRARLE